MSLDGAFLHGVMLEMLGRGLIGGRVDKIFQPSRDEILLSIRTFNGAEKILFSANTSSAAVHLTAKTPENPKQPPVLCMLFRKYLSGGRLTAIHQDGLERILNFDFECMNEIGDTVENRIAAEIMGKYSNIILLTKKEDGWRVVDSVKRVTDDISSVRRVLPNIRYELPPRTERLNLLDYDFSDLAERLLPFKEQRLAKALSSLFEGISPLFARECAYACTRDTDAAVGALTEDRVEKLVFFLKASRRTLLEGNGCTMLTDRSGKPKDFSFIPIAQYGAELVEVRFDSPGALLDRFFGERADADRVKQRSGDLLKTILAIYERTERKLAVRRKELEDCAGREELRICGELLSANLYRAERGMNELVVEDYVNGGTRRIALDLRLTPAQNAQKYFSEYKKLDTAEKMLTKLIDQGEKELLYIDSVFDAASRVGSGAGSEAALAEIRRELTETGYLKPSKNDGRRKEKPLPPLKFRSSDGYEILVGRNNYQNDRLTLKTADGGDLWLHTQKIAGSHVIIRAEGAEIPERTIEEAAILAATCSKGRGGTKIPVDYTRVRYVKKPNGAKPGMVIFTNNRTVLVDPDEGLYERILEK
ncbi:MAG: NFACT family protein [Bacteroides sp.]|nr:NFACT family protein [Eubacterium sp.]MCM1418390.1 NFACT family protein [Roseburia sp.]MCM1462491.1 NFACT family protein [Bacteroides sp.]